MKRKYIYPLLVVIVTVLFYYAESYIPTKNSSISAKSAENVTKFSYLPTTTSDAIVSHVYYTLSYSEKHEQPGWVAYHLKKEHLSKNNFKRPYFEIDKKVKTKAADWRNYKNSGYDKGHLCPAGDRRFSYQAYEETFLTSNIAPQDHKFNAGVWNQLEQKTRYWAKKYDGVYIVTGGVLKGNLKTIGYEAVSIPEYFYKIILDNTSNPPKIIAFLFPNRNTDKSLDQFVVTTDRIEELTGIDFFPALDDALENDLEASNDTNGWKF